MVGIIIAVAIVAYVAIFAFTEIEQRKFLLILTHYHPGTAEILNKKLLNLSTK